ncbi:EpsG family protein [Salegentibacter chungangensis]|uniref:EpsG family protein n=1 Tax=Salegentibacter chungangensis TaxID=1335724 RepID=A0ABW3NPM6_9FLAO
MIRYLSFETNAPEEYLPYFRSKRLILWTTVFALIFVNIPWEIIRGAEFTDIENYIERFSSGVNFSSLINEGFFLKYITSESLWAALILYLKNLGLPLPLVFKSISFFSIFVFGYFTFKKSKSLFLSAFLLLNPLMVDFVMSQIRNSFALSIIIVAMLCNNKWIKLVLLLSSTMIHSSSVVLIFLVYILNKTQYEGKYKNLGVLIIIGLFVAFTLSIGREYILTLIGDRRANIKQPQSSILYSIFWVVYIGLIIYLKKLNVKDIYSKMSFTLILVFFASVVFGAYATRYLAILLPFLIISVLSLKINKNRILSSWVLLFYQLILFTYWID